MGDAYDPEHPTEAPASPHPPSPTREGWTELQMSPGLSMPPQVQSTGDMLTMGEDENAVKAVLNFPKGQASKGCSRFLPKGTKAKVNLEDQGRQKVSFTFNVTKTLRNKLQSAIGSELDEVKTLPTALPLISVKGNQENKSNSETADAPEAAKSSPPKSKVEWSKVHFKKKQLNDAAKPQSLSDREQCSSSVEEPVDAAIKKLSAGGTETVIKVTVETKPTNLNLGTSHVGKDDNIEEFKNVSVSSENDELRKLARTEEFVQALSADSESEMDLVRKSPSLKSHDTKNAESSREVKKYPATSRTDEVEKISSHSKSERDRRSSGRSKSDRDTRKTSSHSKYGREERLSSSRSRSDRDSRAPSSYSKSDWSRSSYYSDKDRYRRGSPYSERSKSSRSKLCADLRDASSCSDSEEDSRRYHPRSNDVRRTSLHSKSYRDSRKYQSRSDRDLRATSSCSESERETKRTKSHAKADKVSRIPAACFESESSKTNSSEVGLDSRKLSKSDCHSKICHSKSSTSCHKPEAARTNVSDLELDYGKISKSDSHLRMVSSHSKSVFSCHEVLLKKNSPGPEIDLRKNSKLDSKSKTHSKTLVYCEIEGAQDDSTELEPDSRRNPKPDINSQISPQNSKSTNCHQTKAVRMDSSEPELDSWTNSTSDKNVILTRSRTKAKTFCGVEIVKMDPAGVELDSQTNSGSDKHSIVTPSHSNSYACLTKVYSSEPETEVDLWENSRLDRKSRINVSSSRFQKIRTLPVLSPDRELRRISSSESEDEMREVPELHNSGTKQNVFRSDDIYSSLDHQSDSCVSTSPYLTSDLSRTCCLSGPSEIAGSSHSSKLDGLLAKVSSCSESDEEHRASSQCESNLMVSSHDLPNDLQSPTHFIVNTMQASPYPSPDEVKYLAYQKVEEFNTSHYTMREHILAYPKMDEFTTVSRSNLDEIETISADSESCMRDVKLTGKESTENRAVDSQKEQHANEGNGSELKNDKLFHNANSFSSYSIKQNATPSNQNWDLVDKVRLYVDLPSHINSEAKESGAVKTEPPSSNNEETSFIARPDSSVKVEPEHRMEISEDEGTDEELTMEVVTEGPLHLSPANLTSTNEMAHNSLSYRTKSDCDSSCMKVEYNSVSSENGDCSEDAKSSSEQESEESETSSDSDDGSVPKNRLQSVVIVPKNSTLTLEEKSPMSSPSSSISSSRISQQEKKHSAVEVSKRETDEKPSVVHQPNGVELGNIPREMVGDPVEDADTVQGTLSLFQEVSEDQPQASSSQLSPISESHKSYKQQLLTDKVDSTSQPERFSIDQNQLPLSNEKSGSVESPGSEGMAERYQHSPSSHLDSLTAEQNSARALHGEDKSFGEKPDSRQAVSWPQQQAQDQGSFHSPEYLESLDWDFSQPEKPSSSCQQPDSSYGLYRKYCYQTEEAELGKTSDHWQDKRASWDPKLKAKSIMCNNYQLCQDISGSDVQGQVQPDSMTDDFASYDNWETVNRDPRSVPKGVSSLQAHEITSNSTKGTTLVLKASDSTGGKESRVRELEKKLDDEQGYSQKPQVEEADTDLESDADTRYCEQVRVEPDPLVTVPSKEWVSVVCKMEEFKNSQWWKEQSKLGMMPPYFELIEENLYLTERKKSKSHRDIKRMQCECVLSREDRERGELACGEDCLNRLLMIECSSRCLHGEYCTNRRFQRRQYADVEVILTERKGWGLRTDKELSVNSFVLEYCGEVLDHKEFKTRVKEYARNKNIHYYFMALKNDEIIDATLKGNCSRFMNHSCEPNCETQKWTVNGQLRVGFFTTKTVPAGTELTFDYQFQRYGKEAQKCFCGSANCRGYLGGENRVSIRAAGGKVKLKDKDRSRKKDSVDEELEAFLENGDGLCDSDQVLSLTRLMVRIETIEQKLTCLKIIQNTHSQSCLKSFLEYHGLSLLWIWMTELGDSRGNSSNSIKLQTEIMKTLELLPIPTKNMLEESKLLPIIQRWAQSKASVPQVSEADGYSSENTSRAQTPLNTQDPGLKQSGEGDSDTPKKLVMRRLKIMSENSMDSGLSDTSKASDGEIELKEAKDEVITTVEPSPCLPTDEEEIQSEVPGDEADPQDSQDPTLKAANGTKLDDGALVETPSQDEEEGVSDVESERSQEQSCKIEDVSELAMKLLDVWKDLKEVYRIPKKDRTQTERESIERGREGTSQKDVSQVPKTPVNLGKEKDADKSLSKDRKKRRPTTSPPPSAYEREGLKRSVPDERYDGATPAKKKKTRSKLSTEERRKLFEQEVAQREAQKQNLFLVQQQQQIQPICVSSQVPYDSGTYTTSHQNFATYPPGYPLQTYVDPVNPNAGKVLLPTPNVEPMCPPQMSYEHPQPILGESMPTGHPPVQHLSPQIDVQGQQYLTQTPNVISQDPSVAVIQVSGTQATGQSYGVWDPNQQTLAVHQQYASGQSQTPIYYQGQPCQTVYSISSPYGQATPQIVQSYTQSSPECAQGQQCFLTHPQSSGTQPATGMLVTSSAPSYQQPGQPQTVQQQELIIVNNLLDLPPPSPPKPKTIVLPTNWKTARDPEGKIYYYHVITRQTQWDPPLWDGGSDEMNMGHEAEMDLGTPTYDEHPAKDPMLTDRLGPDGSGDGTPNSYSQSTKKKPKTAEADTSSELAKRSKEMFRKEISQFIVLCLNPYRKPDCKIGRIVATEDFKHLARKLTHGVMNKELKQCKNPEDLECNENVKHKTKEYIKKYMQKFGAVYKPKEEPDVD